MARSEGNSRSERTRHYPENFVYYRLILHLYACRLSWKRQRNSHLNWKLNLAFTLFSSMKSVMISRHRMEFIIQTRWRRIVVFVGSWDYISLLTNPVAASQWCADVR